MKGKNFKAYPKNCAKATWSQWLTSLWRWRGGRNPSLCDHGAIWQRQINLWIRCIARLIEPTAGSLLLDGEDIFRFDAKELLKTEAQAFKHGLSTFWSLLPIGGFWITMSLMA
ncbi:MAG: hypothetical protein R2880_04225 [Deinococcales bacterium]